MKPFKGEAALVNEVLAELLYFFFHVCDENIVKMVSLFLKYLKESFSCNDDSFFLLTFIHKFNFLHLVLLIVPSLNV